MEDPDVLLSAPTANSEEHKKLFQRKSCKYENNSKKFMKIQREYTRQYSHIYFTRLTKMKGRVKAAAKRRWGEWVGVHLALLCKRGAGEEGLGGGGRVGSKVILTLHCRIGEDIHCEENLAELSGKDGQECCIVGTIFKQMELKPSILKEVSAKVRHAPPMASP